MIKFDSITIQENTFPCVYCDAVIVGTGCAGFNCADTLWNLGVKDIIVISNGTNSGTKNTGSDKQTFYKLSQSKEKDSTMTWQRFIRGWRNSWRPCLAEAALSLRNFTSCRSWSPLPHTNMGYVGYRLTTIPLKSNFCRPLTSKYMTEALKSLNQRASLYLMTCSL